MKIDPNSPAFPTPLIEGSAPGRETGGDFGIPIRLHLAAMAMQGFCAGVEEPSRSPKQIAQIAICQADALIAEYNRTEDKPNAQ